MREDWLSDGIYVLILLACAMYLVLLVQRKITRDHRSTERLITRHPFAWAAVPALGAGLMAAFMSPWLGLATAAAVFVSVRWTAPRVASRRLKK
ncbi:hypothetical protein [Streptomyces sp. NPDC057554]|uniref:hypothetical protein n=1 Tax=Streptomyces sp. NPDC057554 TaxID=3350538 RepID=UPI0036CD68B5